MQTAVNMQHDWNEINITATETDKNDASERTINILYFSALASRLGLDSETITLPEEIITIGDLIPWLMTRRGEWQRALAGNLKITVNRQFSNRSRVICDDDTVALVLEAEENIV